MFNTNTTFIIGLIVIVVFALITMVNPKENFNVKCEFIPWGPSKRACMDRCRNDRKLWGGQACSKSACYGLCESCSDVKKCNWLDRRDTLTDPNVNVDPALATSTDKPLIIRGIEGDTKCVIQWFHDEKYDSYILKYYMSSRPSEGVKVFNSIYTGGIAANIRKDRYGGSLKNRCRIALEIAEKVRKIW